MIKSNKEILDQIKELMQLDEKALNLNEEEEEILKQHLETVKENKKIREFLIKKRKSK